MKALILMGLAGCCLAASDAPVTAGSLIKVENSINQKLTSNVNDPYYLLGTARGTYLDGYGAVFTVAMNLIVVPPLSIGPPFGAKITPAVLTEFHDRKVKKMAALKETMRDAMTAAACQSLQGLGADDRIVMEAFLFNYNWEDMKNLPNRIVLVARKQKLVDAVNRHAGAADIAALFEEQEF